MTNTPGIDLPQLPIVKGDAKSISIAAASIVAKVVRDRQMIELDRLPKEGDEFDFESRHKIFHVRVIKADSRRALMTRIKVEDKPDEDD